MAGNIDSQTPSIHDNNAFNILDGGIPYSITILHKKQTINFCSDTVILKTNDCCQMLCDRSTRIRRLWQLARQRPTPSVFDNGDVHREIGHEHSFVHGAHHWGLHTGPSLRAGLSTGCGWNQTRLTSVAQNEQNRPLLPTRARCGFFVAANTLLMMCSHSSRLSKLAGFVTS